MARLLIFLALMVCLVLTGVVGKGPKGPKGQKLKEKVERIGGIEAKVHGQSGKISITNRRAHSKRKEKLEIDFDELKERDINGKEIKIKAGGKYKHGYNSFSNLEFYFSPLKQLRLQGLRVAAFNFSADVPSTGATFTCNFYLFRDAGEIEWGEEAVRVGNGTIKFNIEVRGWNFCNGSQNGCIGDHNKEVFGHYLDTQICIKGWKKPKREKKDDHRKLGKGRYKNKRYMRRWIFGNAKMEMPSEVMIDNEMRTMPEDYPMYKAKGNKFCFRLRFPKFNESAVYDPTINSADDAEYDYQTSAATGTSSWSGLPVFVLAYLASYWLF